MMRDFDEPDLATAAIIVAARHVGTVGITDEFATQRICHLNRVINAVQKLKEPSCVWHEVQKTLSPRGEAFPLDKPAWCGDP